jgi:hypothetical protein
MVRGEERERGEVPRGFVGVPVGASRLDYATAQRLAIVTNGEKRYASNVAREEVQRR